MILGITGHRLHKIAHGYDLETRARLDALALAGIRKHSPTRIISGFAWGWDLACAKAGFTLGIPVTAAVPYDGFHLDWEPEDQAQWLTLLIRATVVYVSEPGYQVYKLHKRNEWVVDQSERLLGFWDGKETGGTYSTIQYALKKGKKVVNLYPSWLKYGKSNPQPV